MNKLSIVNACCDLGVNVTGASLGPEIITQNISNKKIYTIRAIETKKELQKENKQKNLTNLNEFNIRLYNTVKQIVNENQIPLTIGGDHSIAIASALASISKHKNLGIIWFDAHGDFNTFATTETGNIHGLPLAAITNYEKKNLTYFHNGNFYNYKNTVIVGGRDIDPLEKENIKKAGISFFSTDDIIKYGVKTICEKAFKIALNGTNGVHISYDIDLINPKIAPGVSVPAIGGINLEEAYAIVDEIISIKDNVKSIDIVEFNPLKDKDQITENITKTIFNKIIESF